MTDAPSSPILMPTAPLGRTGPIVSRLALGAMTFGAETHEDVAFEQLDTFVDAGGTLVDTPDVYADGVEDFCDVPHWKHLGTKTLRPIDPRQT